MKKVKAILLIIYLSVISIIGIFFVPCYVEWGRAVEKNIITLQYVPIWRLTDITVKINDSIGRYELNISRIIYNFVLITLIAGVLYLLLHFLSNPLQSKTK